MMGEGNGVVSAATLKGRERERVVEGPSGNRYRIRRIPNRELPGLLGTLPQVGAMPVSDAEERALAEKLTSRMQADAAEGIRRAEALIAAALVEPKLGDGPDEITLDDIPFEDVGELSRQVLDLSGLNRANAARLRPTSASVPS